MFFAFILIDDGNSDLLKNITVIIISKIKLINKKQVFLAIKRLELKCCDGRFSTLVFYHQEKSLALSSKMAYNRKLGDRLLQLYRIINLIRISWRKNISFSVINKFERVF